MPEVTNFQNPISHNTEREAAGGRKEAEALGFQYGRQGLLRFVMSYLLLTHNTVRYRTSERVLCLSKLLFTMRLALIHP
jgi:hypothetical protein